MKTQRRDASDERRVLTGMIFDGTVLARLSAVWDDSGPFRGKWTNLVGGWCVSHFRRYGKPPAEDVEAHFTRWAEKSQDEATVTLVEKFLGTLEVPKTVNAEHVVDLAGALFNRVRVERLRDDLDADLDAGEVEKAIARAQGIGRVEAGAGSCVDVFADGAAIDAAFDSKSEVLIEYPGALGKFFRDALERDALVAFMAPEKRGKSFWLLDVAYRAASQRRRVAFFEVGDMSQNQIMRRFMSRVARRPVKPRTVKWPLSISRAEGEDVATVEHREIEFKEGLTKEHARLAAEKFRRRVLKSKQPYLRLSCHPNSTLNVQGVSAVLKTWEAGGWTPDVVVVDYADILAAPAGVTETRDQINTTWKQLRALSQSLHCLVVTATQSDAASYKTSLLGRSNFADDKRKYAHVTAMFGVNQTEPEKAAGVCRLNTLVLREDEFAETGVVHVAECRSLASPAVLSCF